VEMDTTWMPVAGVAGLWLVLTTAELAGVVVTGAEFAMAGVMVSASHLPREYQDGCG
jgi:hypothetical protein